MFSRRSVDGMSSSRELYDTCTSHCPHIPRGRAGYPHPCTPLPAHLAHTAQARPHVREVDVRPLVGSVSPHYEGLGPSILRPCWMRRPDPLPAGKAVALPDHGCW